MNENKMISTDEDLELAKVLEEMFNSPTRVRYVSDVFDIDKEVQTHGKKIFLIAGVGAGKSSWVKDVLTKKGNVLFITSRRAKVDEDVRDSIFKNAIRALETDCQTLITNARLAYALESWNLHTTSYDISVDEFLDHYNYIVVDEVHSIATDSTFADSSFDILTFIEYAAERGKTIVAMTGTPEPVEAYFDKNKWYKLDLRDVCNYVRPAAIHNIKKDNILPRIKEALEKGKKIVYFVNGTDTIKELYRELPKKDKVTNEQIVKVNELAAIVAQNKHNKLEKDLEELFGDGKTELIEKCKAAYESIVEEKQIPEECKVLISTSKLREGVDIMTEDVTVICDNHILSNIIQFCGRVRMGGGQVYIVEDAEQHPVDHDELILRYGKLKERDAANGFMKESIEAEGNALTYEEKYKFIKYMKKNPYVRFNYIRNEFQIFSLRYEEEERIIKCRKNWKQMLADYCEKYNIRHTLEPSLDNAIKLICLGCEKYVVNDVKEFDKEKQASIMSALQGVLKIPMSKRVKQISRFNDILQEYNIPYELCAKTESSGERRNQRYWYFRRTERQ